MQYDLDELFAHMPPTTKSGGCLHACIMQSFGLVSFLQHHITRQTIPSRSPIEYSPLNFSLKITSWRLMLLLKWVEWNIIMIQSKCESSMTLQTNVPKQRILIAVKVQPKYADVFIMVLHLDTWCSMCSLMYASVVSTLDYFSPSFLDTSLVIHFPWIRITKRSMIQSHCHF